MGPALVERHKDETGWVQYRDGRVLRLRTLTCRLGDRRVDVEGQVAVWNVFHDGWEAWGKKPNVREEIAGEPLEELARVLQTAPSKPPPPESAGSRRGVLVAVTALAVLAALFAPLAWLLWS